MAGERTKILRRNPTPAAVALTALSFLVFTAAEEEGELGPDHRDRCGACGALEGQGFCTG